MGPFKGTGSFGVRAASLAGTVRTGASDRNLTALTNDTERVRIGTYSAIAEFSPGVSPASGRRLAGALGRRAWQARLAGATMN
jgi:hypothetical protein